MIMGRFGKQCMCAATTARSPSHSRCRARVNAVQLTLAQGDIPIVNEKADADQAQSAPSKMQPPVRHSMPDHHNKPGTSVGKGVVAPVPKKLAEKIWKWEFVEMSEMVAESLSQKSDKSSTGLVAGNRRRCPVTEVIPWIHCFAAYTSVMSRRFPESVPELLAYMTGIIRASREYGPAWTQYDSAFRRQAASTGNRIWYQINPSLHAVCFTGRAEATPRCSTCASIDHTIRDWPYSVKTDLETRTRATRERLTITRTRMDTNLGIPIREGRATPN